MNIVPSAHAAVQRFLQKSADLTRVGILYVVASICQISWLYLVVSNWETAKLWLDFPMLWWLFIFIWGMMIWCIPHLFFIGLQMIRMSGNPKIIITQNEYQRSRQTASATLLILGIILDVILFPLLLGAEDKDLVVLLTGVMGGRVTQANLEAIAQYHNV